MIDAHMWEWMKESGLSSLNRRAGTLLLAAAVMIAGAWPRGTILCQARDGHLAVELQSAWCCAGREPDFPGAELCPAERHPGENCSGCRDTGGSALTRQRVSALRAVSTVAALPPASRPAIDSPLPALPSPPALPGPAKAPRDLRADVILQV